MEISDKTQKIGQVQQRQAIVNERSQEPETTVGAPAGDRVDVSAEAQRRAMIHKVVEVVTDAQEVDREKVAALKDAIAQGTYRPDSKKVAERLLQEESYLSRIFSKD